MKAGKKQTFSSFDDLIQNSDLPLLVDFHATWCGPCQLLGPILQNISNQMKDQLRVVKIDTDKYPKIASRYNIQALPTLILFNKGRPVDRIEGLPSEQALVEVLRTQLQKLGST